MLSVQFGAVQSCCRGFCVKNGGWRVISGVLLKLETVTVIIKLQKNKATDRLDEAQFWMCDMYNL